MSHGHACTCSIIPPHILEHIAQNGTAHEKQAAADSLALTARQRIVRAALRGAPQAPALTAFARPHKARTISDTKHTSNLPGATVRTEGGPPTGDAAADEAFEGLGATYDLFWDVFHRDSIDDAGLPLNATVHYGANYNNAFWNGQRMVFGDGDGSLFNRFTIAIDIMGHELAHGVTGTTAALVYSGQSGALNESMSDVFGSLVKQHSKGQSAATADWLIGQGIFAAGVSGIALRSMKAPGTAYNDPKLGKDPQPGDMKDYVNTTRDNGGVHINSGIPNHAFYLVAIALGGNAWEKAGNIWYRTLLDSRLTSTAQFQDFANLTVEVAGRLYGKLEKEVVIDAWQDVGIGVYDEEKWVTSLYADLLGRAPDKAGLDGWVAARLGGASLRDIVRGFLNSVEYCTNVVTSFYRGLLGRDPDPAGLQGWVGSLQSGRPRHEILAGFLDSAEYKSKHAPPAQFVESLYQSLLGRASDPNGKQGWIDALAAGATTADVIRGFLFSEEHCTQRVTELYQTLLSRAPDPAGLVGWVGAMMNGAAFQEIQYGFLASDEYRAACLVRFVNPSAGSKRAVRVAAIQSPSATSPII